MVRPRGPGLSLLVAFGLQLLGEALARATGNLGKEVVVPLEGGGRVALSTRGPLAFRARFIPAELSEDPGPAHSNMVAPEEADAPFSKVKWEQLGGPNTVCRLTPLDRTADGRGSVQSKVAESMEMCRSLCEQASDCMGVEWGEDDRRCEFWTRPIGATGTAARHSCHNFTRKAADARAISVVGLGSLAVTAAGNLELRGASGELLTVSSPLGQPGPTVQAPARAKHPGGWFQGTPGETGDQQVWSGDSIYLRASSGNFLEAEDVKVEARSTEAAEWQRFVVESRSGDGPIHHGDTVFLHTHLGSAIDAHDSQVLARWDAHGLWQELTVERKYGPGMVKAGDVVRLKSSQGAYITVEGVEVRATSSPLEPTSQLLTVSKAPSTRSLRSGDGIWLRHVDGQLLEADGGQVVARPESHAASQRWLVRKKDAEAGSPIFSGDTVMLLAFTGIPLEVWEGTVSASSTEASDWQDIILEAAEGDGQILDGQTIFLKSSTGAYVNVANATVEARWPDRGQGQSFVVVTRPTTCAQTVALNGTVAASSWQPDAQPFRAVDGDSGTAWTSRPAPVPAEAPSADGEWLSLDLGAVHDLSRVEIRWEEKRYASSYLVQGMLEGHQWTTFASALGREGWTVTVLPRTSRARWVRVRSFGATAFGSCGVAEFVVHACQRTIAFSTRAGRLYGRGASPFDAHSLTAVAVQPQVSNRAAYAPYYYSTDGYGALGVVRHREHNYNGRIYPVSYITDGERLLWGYHGDFVLYLMPAPTLEAGTQALLALTGAPRVPPRFAFGFLATQSEWGSRDAVEDTLQAFRAGGFPLDAIVVGEETGTSRPDYSSWEGIVEEQDFALRNSTFPSARRQLDHYRSKLHVRVCGSRVPMLRSAALLEEAALNGWLLPQGTSSGSYPPDTEGAYAFGQTLNFSKPEVRAWYSEQLLPLLDAGIACWWNEDGEADYYTYYWWNVAESDALRMGNATEPRRRFYSANRGFSPGMARLGATAWTGDIDASWEDLARAPGMVLNWGLAGAPYVGCDIGGFSGETESVLLVRWMQAGVFLPTMRVNSALMAKPHWPWGFGEEPAAAMREALQLRYRLVPYHYSLAHGIYDNRALWVRPMAMDFPGDPVAAALTEQWMDGRMLVAPILREDSHRQVYLPDGEWYRFNSSTSILGPAHLGGRAELAEIPMFVRPGMLLPLAPAGVLSTDELPGGPLEMQIYRGADGAFELVEDDGETVAYEVGRVRTTSFRWYDAAGTLSWRARGSVAVPGGRAFTSLFVTTFDASTRRTRRLGPFDLTADGGSTVSEPAPRLA